MKLLFVCVKSIVVCLALALVCGVAFTSQAQTNYYSQNGTEYSVAGSLLGDQVFPDVAISPTNGIVVWQDNATDGNGLGISARRLDGTLSGTLSTFRVNATTAGDQQNPHVKLLKKGGAAVVWQGGPLGFQHIFARFLTATNTFLTTTDILLSASTRYQINPALTVLTNGNVVIVWSSFNQVSSNSMYDVYGQILSTNGAKIGTNFLINQFTTYNQRTPAVSALQNGGFVVSWVSEQQNLSIPPSFGSNTVSVTASSVSRPSVDIYARVYTASGVPTTAEVRVTTNNIIGANPAMAPASDGGFMMVWSGFDPNSVSNSWDIYARPFSSAGVGRGTTVVNTHVYGDQYVPGIAVVGSDYLVTWTSLGQDGSREGVYGQFVHAGGVPVGGEFRVNTTTAGSQMQPTVAADGVSQFLVVWSSFAGFPNGFDLFGQRFLNVASILQAMSAPYVWAPFTVSNTVYQPQLYVSWAPVLGLSVADYEIYVNGAGAPACTVTNTGWTMTSAYGLTASSTNYFQVDYVTSDGRRSPLSPAAWGATWNGLSWGGIPFEWMAAFYGNDATLWPSPNTKLAGPITVYQVFISGGSPLDPSSWLAMQFTKTGQGMFVSWNTDPGAVYQVQIATNLISTWKNLGSPRFAAGTNDSLNVGSGANSYFRIQLLR